MVKLWMLALESNEDPLCLILQLFRARYLFFCDHAQRGSVGICKVCTIKSIAEHETR
jgi:hypothetical protein